MDTFIVDVDEVNDEPQFSSPSQVTGVSLAADGTVSIQRTAPVDVRFRWAGDSSRCFCGVEHNQQAVTSGPISGTPLTADIPTSSTYTEFTIGDDNPGDACQWEFLIAVSGGSTRKITWVDPKIHNEGADPHGGTEPCDGRR